MQAVGFAFAVFLPLLLLGDKNKMRWGKRKAGNVTKLSFLVQSINGLLKCAHPSARVQN